MGKKLTVTIEEYVNVDETFQNIKNIKVGSMTLNDLFGDNLKVIENALEERKKLLKWKDSQQDLIKGKDEYIAKLCNDRAELKEQLKQVEDFKYHYDSYKTKLVNNLKTINCMQEEETTNRNLIDSLEDRNDRLVERLEKQKIKLKELKKDNHSLTKTIAQLTEADYYFITSMALDMLKGNSNFALMYVDDIFCLVDTKNNSFEVIDNYDIDTENIGKSKCQELNDLREFAKIISDNTTTYKNHKTIMLNNNMLCGVSFEQLDLVKKVVEKYGKKRY